MNNEDLITFFKKADSALTSLLSELRRQGQGAGPHNNLQIIQAAENWLGSLWKSLREKEQELNDLREICAKRFRWITKAREAMHPTRHGLI